MTRECDTLEERRAEKADERGGVTDRIVLERVRSGNEDDRR
ncbi:hypothetical protein [Natrinema versiforme]|nr:hypothetical protein [Natrinema versiforme]